MLDRLDVRVLRVNLSWGGRWRPSAVRYASPYDIEVLLTILETPEWANDRLGGGSRRSTRSPRSCQD